MGKRNKIYYGLVYDPLATAAAEVRAQGRLITIHPSQKAARNYYFTERSRLSRLFADPIQQAPGSEGRGIFLPLWVITQNSFTGSALTLKDLSRAVTVARDGGNPCYSVRHVPDLAQPELIGNEVNKITLNSDLLYSRISPKKLQQHLRTQSTPKP